MSVNFNKDHQQIVSAYKSVLDKECTTNWALFGYDKLSNDLILVDKGDGGLEELYNEFSQSKILYAFCEARDEKAQLSRYILINWQGECAPMQRKGVCMNHFADVCSFFKGAHITINARNEEDVEPSILMEHVSMLTMRMKIEKTDDSQKDTDRKPIGTCYKRIVPQNEISQSERETFWQKQKQEEEDRQREKKQKEAQVKLALSNVKRDNAPEVGEKSNRVVSQSVQLRKERLEEAKTVSKNSVNSAKAFFEQNSAASQVSQRIERPPINIREMTEPVETPPKVEVPTVQSNGHSKVELEDNLHQHLKEDEIDDVAEKVVEEANGHVSDDDQVTEPEMVVKTEETNGDAANGADPYSGDVSVNYPPQYCNFFPETRTLENIEEEQVSDDENVNPKDDTDASHGLQAKALYDYEAADSTEISFLPDDIISHIEQIDEGWWQGLSPSGTYGLFPANYVELLQ